ncbi:sigma-70 family RNA polymerase sigma factor [Aliifodinibius sp. S!AR15-10]|uniref:RNA polymerase sigma factor n=1 Tax=Aliifodinibius sp. S!AR15-10 TaxID=2950437 RepID=UPI0028639774|nr:sigma-70 family RNA polymerase sigma factor [Aliifodinibius sp. S!AR15-10]MDR8392565.1 sigma-70 family RNA polymerase sigma factor [Aliifodinibius sp. S!AR15-10]
MSDSEQQKSQSPRENPSESSLEDDVLVKKAIGGDEKAYKKLVNKYERAIYFHILKMVKDKKQVEDLVQETFVKAFDNLNTYSTNYAFSTWLYRIATNHTIDYLRKKKLQTLSIDEPVKTRDGDMQMQLPDDDASTDRKIIRQQRQQMVQQAIEDLPPKYRKVIQMRHMEEKSYQEIAEVLDKPLGTVKAHIFRAREMLYKALKDKKDRF